jgi:parvulin-like peptidyl-prolyl isomerase
MEVIAKVYGHEIRRSEFMRELDRLSKIVDNFMICTLQKKALKVIIDRYLLLHEAEHEHFDITTEEYNDELFDFINEFETEDDFDAMLLKNRLTEIDIREIVNNKIILRKHIEKYQTEPDDIPEEKLRLFYKQNHNLFQTQEEVSCKHILVKNQTEESKVRAEWIRREIKNTDDFNEAVVKYSECPTIKKCGDLGFFHRGKLIQEIEDIAFKMSLNEISDPFPSKMGYHILMLTGRHDPKTLPYEDIKDLLRMRLEHIDSELKLVKHFQELRDASKEHIEFFEENLLAPFNCLFT